MLQWEAKLSCIQAGQAVFHVYKTVQCQEYSGSRLAPALKGPVQQKHAVLQCSVQQCLELLMQAVEGPDLWLFSDMLPVEPEHVSTVKLYDVSQQLSTAASYDIADQADCLHLPACLPSASQMPHAAEQAAFQTCRTAVE